ncbi:serine/threonine-protein phosphatase [bacterium]|nr:serine/threonine-protein phosphatase [bacterium]
MAQVSADGTTTLHEMAGFPVGFVPDVEFDEDALTLSPGDRLYLYSDGVPEAMNAEREQFGDEAMKDVLSKGQGTALDGTVAALLSAVETWCVPNGPLDDVSILGLEWGGPG